MSRLYIFLIPTLILALVAFILGRVSVKCENKVSHDINVASEVINEHAKDKAEYNAVIEAIGVGDCNDVDRLHRLQDYTNGG